jgi:pimeloyl-ACP methyl ester carboxylesterase
MPLTDRVLAWERTGEYADIGHRRIFVKRIEGSTEKTPVLLLHGFPSSSYDWRHVLPLIEDRTVVAFDFLGFGLSDKPRDMIYSLRTQADLTEEIVHRYAGGEAVVVAHDMATSVATELMARDLEGSLSFKLHKALLINGSVIIEKAVLTTGQRLLRSRVGGLFARLSTEVFFRQEFRRIFSPFFPLSDADAADYWSLLSHKGGNQLMNRLTHYIGERSAYAERWHGAIRDWPRHLELAWGLLDPVAVLDVLDGLIALRPHVPVTRWPKLGHYPQLEQPGTVAEKINAL